MKGKYFILVVLLFGGIITGCDKKQTLVCKKQENTTGMIINTERTTEFKNDEISNLTTKIEVNLNNSYIKYKTTIQNSLATQYNMYKNKKGVTYNINSEGNKIILTLTVDNKQLNKETRKELNIPSANYDTSKQTLTSEGYTCK